MWVGEIDVSDDDLVRRYWEAGREAEMFGRPFAVYWTLQSAMVAFQASSNSVEQHPIAAFVGDEIVGTNQVVLPVLDNRHLAYVEPLVRPAWRGRGIGSALLEASFELARRQERTTVVAEVPMAIDECSAGQAFAAKHGFSTGILDIHRVLDLPVDAHRLDALAESAARHCRAYDIVLFDDAVPEDHLAGYCELNSVFNAEAPKGDLVLEAEVWDAERVRSTEARFRLQGRRTCSALAVARDGSVVGLSELMAVEDDPELGMQSGTLVSSKHRGHRLGMALKVANLRRFQERFAAVRRVHSWNAEENGPMVAINDTLGFRPVEHVAEMQRSL